MVVLQLRVFDLSIRVSAYQLVVPHADVTIVSDLSVWLWCRFVCFVTIGLHDDRVVGQLVT